ncbi:hypothetical protein [Labrys neptuniae]
MTKLRPALAIGASLFALAAASLLDVARMQPQQVAASRGDRLNVASLATDCSKNSLIAACAGDASAKRPMPPVMLIQVFEDSGKTTLVKTPLVR